MFAEGIFLGGGESLILYPPPSKVASKLCVPLIPPRDVPVDIHIKVMAHAKFHCLCLVYYRFQKMHLSYTYIHNETMQCPRTSESGKDIIKCS